MKEESKYEEHEDDALDTKREDEEKMIPCRIIVKNYLPVDVVETVVVEAVVVGAVVVAETAVAKTVDVDEFAAMVKPQELMPPFDNIVFLIHPMYLATSV